ncbi:MAG: T9SS type A sorting domain-containing protein [Crocinitomicaceae bacterium]|nr:T9SS type A sorting domain-containing protein [Crocinitomicaceae bacterium]
MKLLLLIGCSILFIGTTYCQNNITWDPPADVSSSVFDNNFPRIVMDASGDPMVTWSDGDNLYFAKWNGTGFSAPAQLNPGGVTIAGLNWQGPDIASRGDTLYAVYKQTPETASTSYVWCVSSFDGGQNFNAPVRVDYIADSISRFPTVSVDNTGNPLVGFMKFNSDFSEARWVVAKSTDMGASFNTDELASEWSSPTSEVCDCCPGQIVSEGNTVAMLYRDNFSNVRDTWAGISNDGGSSFVGGMDVDQLGWVIMSCPSSGPDGVIIGDTLYSTYMSGASNIRVYYNKSSISSLTGSPAIPLDQSVSGLASQNYPRLDHSENAMAFVWQQVASASQQLAIQFTEDITTGINTIQEIVDSDNIGHVDVALQDGVIFVVWEDGGSGTVKYRRGTYNNVAELDQNETISTVRVFPNPSNDQWRISGIEGLDLSSYTLLDNSGSRIPISIEQTSNELIIRNKNIVPGTYHLRITTDSSVITLKVLKQ